VTADAGFVIDEAPGLPGTIVVSACSGHGFKHSAGIGETVAQLVARGRSDIDTAPFRLARLLG
jgi:sarcosine oxidase